MYSYINSLHNKKKTLIRCDRWCRLGKSFCTSADELTKS